MGNLMIRQREISADKSFSLGDFKWQARGCQGIHTWQPTSVFYSLYRIRLQCVATEMGLPV